MGESTLKSCSGEVESVAKNTELYLSQQHIGPLAGC